MNNKYLTEISFSKKKPLFIFKAKIIIFSNNNFSFIFFLILFTLMRIKVLWVSKIFLHSKILYWVVPAGGSVQKTSDDEVTNDLQAGLDVGSLSQVNYESGKFVQLSYWNITNNTTTAQQLPQTASHPVILVRKLYVRNFSMLPWLIQPIFPYLGGKERWKSLRTFFPNIKDCHKEM